MASIGHFAVGMGAARLMSTDEKPTWRSMVAWSALSMLPDADVLGMALGIAYENPFGHRGATHSLLFAVVVGSIAGLMASRLGLARLRTAVIAIAVLASHGLLDTLTDGGLGCALLWPFDLTRYFAPWRPIPVSPIGLGFLSPQGAFVAATELIIFSPLLFFALRTNAASTSRRVDRPLLVMVVLWLASVWLIGSTDAVRQTLLARILGADTEYPIGFSSRSFGTISTGMTMTDVAHIAGLPLVQWWDYSPVSTPQCRVVRIEGDRVVAWDHSEECTPAGVQPGMASGDVLRQLGVPHIAVWEYSRSRNGAWFQANTVVFFDGHVRERSTRWATGGPP